MVIGRHLRCQLIGELCTCHRNFAKACVRHTARASECDQSRMAKEAIGATRANRSVAPKIANQLRFEVVSEGYNRASAIQDDWHLVFRKP